MGEFDLIDAYFKHGYPTCEHTLIGVGDDASHIRPPSPTSTLVQSIDTQVASVHFPANAAADKIATRALRCATSDIIAMGAIPSGFHLAITLSDHQGDDWLQLFARGLKDTAKQFSMALLGGDTTSGQTLVITIQVQGWLASEYALTRCGASNGDDVWLSQSQAGLGGAHLALPEVTVAGATADSTWSRAYFEPELFPHLGTELLGIASAAMDVSDGLMQDAQHMAAASGVDIHIQADNVRTAVEQNHLNWQACFNGGDDYQLLFCAPQQQRNTLLERFHMLLNSGHIHAIPQRIGDCQTSTHTPRAHLWHKGKSLTVGSGFNHR